MRLAIPLALAALSLPAHATPIALGHQVRALDAAGQPLQGAHDLTVTLWRHPSSTASGDRLWSRAFADVALADGFASLRLDVGEGGAAVDSDWFADDVWVGLAVDGGAELTPRQQLVDAPRAGFAQVAARVRVEGAPSELACDEAGALVYDSSAETLRVCTGSAWRTLYTSTEGSAATNPGTSCKSLHAAQPTLPTGRYWIDPDGPAGAAPYEAYCNMADHGGGWTLVARFTNGCMTDMRAAAGTLTAPDQPACAKLSDVAINALRTSAGADGVFWGWQASSQYPMPAPRFLRIMSGEFNASDYLSGLTQQCSCSPTGPWSATYNSHGTMAGVYNHSASAWQCVAAGATGCTAGSGTSALFLYQHALHQAGTFPSNSHSVPGGSAGYLYLR
jgi:hypothetical protein